jgi:hypothetical protein
MPPFFPLGSFENEAFRRFRFFCFVVVMGYLEKLGLILECERNRRRLSERLNQRDPGKG